MIIVGFQKLREIGTSIRDKTTRTYNCTKLSTEYCEQSKIENVLTSQRIESSKPTLHLLKPEIIQYKCLSGSSSQTNANIKNRRQNAISQSIKNLKENCKKSNMSKYGQSDNICYNHILANIKQRIEQETKEEKKNTLQINKQPLERFQKNTLHLKMKMNQIRLQQFSSSPNISKSHYLKTEPAYIKNQEEMPLIIQHHYCASTKTQN